MDKKLKDYIEKITNLKLNAEDIRIVFHTSNESGGYATLIQYHDTFFLLRQDCLNSPETFQTLKVSNEKIFI